MNRYLKSNDNDNKLLLKNNFPSLNYYETKF